VGAEPSAQVGQVIAGRYEIVRLLGQGGMGAVYQAKQISMDRMVALKLIHPHVATSPDVVKRFHREMQACSRIEHPNTIQVFDYGDEKGQLFLAMEFLDGKPLGKVLAEAGALPLSRLLHITIQITRALGAAHQRGIAHRDLKPDNVMLLERYGEPDFVKVLDFGIARFLEEQTDVSKMTAEGALIGTPMYMSPEQALGKTIDHRSDFYSLGVMLYQMALGQPPFNGPTLASLIVAHAQEAPTPPSSVKPGIVPASLEKLILRLLAKDPTERPETAAELLHLLEGCKGGDLALASTEAGTTARPIVEPQPTPPPPSRWPMFLVAGLVVAGGGLAAMKLLGGNGKGTEARARFEALFVADGDPLPPESCRTADGKEMEKLAKADAWLHDSQVGKPRPQDRDALVMLEQLKDGGAEYWALLSRARLVVEPGAENALAAAQKALEKCPEFAMAHNLVGNAEQRAKRNEPAAAAYKKALELAPDYEAPRFNHGVLAVRAGDHAAAVAAFDALLQKNPLHARARLARGQSRAFLGQLPGAIEDLEQAVLRHPELAEAWLLLGQVRKKSGEEKGASEAFCKAKTLGNEEGAKLCP
jgi:Flp pilus assembly protein TadD